MAIKRSKNLLTATALATALTLGLGACEVDENGDVDDGVGDNGVTTTTLFGDTDTTLADTTTTAP